MPKNSTAPLTAALVLEVELPTFYAEDLRADDPNWQDWLKATDTDPADLKAVGQEILHNIGEVSYGLLTVHIAGEKDGEIIRTPALMVGARVEDRPPEPEEKWKEVLDDFEADVEAAMMARCDHAMLKVLEPFARRVARLAEAHDHAEQPEEFKTVVAWAVDAMAKANNAGEDAEHAA